MGVFDSKDLGTLSGEHFHHPTDHCFYCADPLSGDQWIFWNGTGCQIWMHPDCAKRLSDQLNKDWENFKREHPEKV